MEHTHEFDCKRCGAHLDSREELDKHNREHHAAGSRSDQSKFNSSNPSDRSSERT